MTFEIFEGVGGLGFEISEGLSGTIVVVHLAVHELIQCVLKVPLLWWLVWLICGKSLRWWV